MIEFAFPLNIRGQKMRIKCDIVTTFFFLGDLYGVDQFYIGLSGDLSLRNIRISQVDRTSGVWDQ